jgi:hypothetical protein
MKVAMFIFEPVEFICKIEQSDYMKVMHLISIG